MADGRGERPLLIETVPGEKAGAEWVRAGQVMAFLGSVVVIAYAAVTILSGPSLVSGWEATWFMPNSGFDLACPAGLVILLMGVVIYYYGLRRQRRGAR
jgi:hypothetical protein